MLFNHNCRLYRRPFLWTLVSFVFCSGAASSQQSPYNAGQLCGRGVYSRVQNDLQAQTLLAKQLGTGIPAGVQFRFSGTITRDIGDHSSKPSPVNGILDTRGFRVVPSNRAHPMFGSEFYNAIPISFPRPANLSTPIKVVPKGNHQFAIHYPPGRMVGRLFRSGIVEIDPATGFITSVKACVPFSRNATAFRIEQVVYGGYSIKYGLPIPSTITLERLFGNITLTISQFYPVSGSR